jgi:hypothetical protein
MPGLERVGSDQRGTVNIPGARSAEDPAQRGGEVLLNGFPKLGFLRSNYSPVAVYVYQFFELRDELFQSRQLFFRGQKLLPVRVASEHFQRISGFH